MLHINESGTELHVYRSSGTDADLEADTTLLDAESPDTVIPAADVESIQFNERLAQRKDDGRIVLNNPDGQYTDAVISGDRIEVHIDYTIPELETWGDGAWGDATWGGERLVWTCWVRDRDLTHDAAGFEMMTIDAEDFVFGLLGERFTDLSFENDELGGVLSALLTTDAPSLFLSVNHEIEETVDATFAGTNLLDAVNHTLGQGEMLAHGYRNMLVAEYITERVPTFEITGDDVGLFDIEETDDQLVNFVRVDGGTARGLDHQWPPDGPSERTDWATVGGDDYHRFWMPATKSEIASFKLWTETVSEDSLTVRINHVPESLRESGEPVPKRSSRTDLAQRQLSHEFIADGGWTEFLMSDHNLHTERPLVIIESSGEDGQRVALADGGGGGVVPVYQSYYPYNIVSRETDSSSVSKHRRREDRIVDDEIQSFNEARAVAREVISHHGTPDQQIHTTAASRRMHMLRPGQVVTLDFPDESIVGDYIVTERSADYTELLLETELTLQQASTV